MILLAAFLAVIAAAADREVHADGADRARGRHGRRLVLTDKGARGLWTVGSPVSVRWRQQGLRNAPVTVEIEDDAGWRPVGTAPASSRTLTFTADGAVGSRARVRVRTESGRIRTSAREVEFVSPLRQVSFATWFGVAVHEDGHVRYWGERPSGFTTPPVPQMVYSPVVLPEFSDVVSVAAGGLHFVAITSDGSAWLWGERYDIGPLAVAVTATRVEGITDAVWARATYGRSFIKVADGRVFSVGGNGNGIFDEGPTPVDVPKEWPALRDVEDIQFGAAHALALREDGTVLSMGNDLTGQLGDGSGGRSYPALVPGVTDVVAIAARGEGSMALQRDGTVLAWGQAAVQSPNYRRPAQVPGMDRVVEIGCAELAAYALRDDGVLWAWGLNGNGELADGTTVDPPEEPRPVLAGVARFFVGSAGVHVITTDGRRLGWGDGSTVGDGVARVRPPRTVPVPIYSR